MRRLLIFLFLFFFLSSVNSQDLRNGTYVGDKTTDFLIVSNDSICFRLLTSSGLFVSTIGIGTYSYADGSLYVKTCERIYQATTEITMIERTDSLFSFRVLDSDNNPLRNSLVSINHKNTYKEKEFDKCVFGWFPIVCEKPILTNEDGYVNTIFFKDYFGQNIEIVLSLLGNAQLKATIPVEKGYDVIMRSKIPSILPYGLIIGDGAFKISIMKDGSIEHVLEEDSCPNHQKTYKLLFYSEDSSFDLGCFQATYPFQNHRVIH